jgi:hypothetical protein
LKEQAAHKKMQIKFGGKQVCKYSDFSAQITRAPFLTAFFVDQEWTFVCE